MDGISLNTVKISEILGVAEKQVPDGSVSSVAATGGSAQQTRAAVSGVSSQPGGKQFKRLVISLYFQANLTNIRWKNPLSLLGNDTKLLLMKYF